MPLAVTGNRAAAGAILLVEEELARWPGPAERDREASSRGEGVILRAAAKAPDESADAVAPFMRAALGGAPGVMHDAAARALAALIAGAAHHGEGRLAPEGKTKALLQSLMPALHTAEALSALPSRLRMSIHEIVWLDESRLIFALPSLTRGGAQVLRTPPELIALLRSAYRDVLRDAHDRGHGCRAGTPDELPAEGVLRPDPTSHQREGNRSIIYDGRSDSKPEERGASPLSIVEWAALPESLHARILDEIRPLAEQWCGCALAPVRFFGVRRYRRGAALESHVDSDPMARAIGVSITVDVEDLEADWTLHAHGAHPGDAAAAAALPVGECFVYEACRVRHFRPNPLRGAVFANAFCHFALQDWQ